MGEKLGLALVDLWRRTKEWQPNDNATSNLLSYCGQQGYLSLAENVTHATAILTFAEQAQIQELWTNAFVHCVGMHERLDMSGDYPGLSNSNLLLRCRAALLSHSGPGSRQHIRLPLHRLPQDNRVHVRIQLHHRRCVLNPHPRPRQSEDVQSIAYYCLGQDDDELFLLDLWYAHVPRWRGVSGEEYTAYWHRG